MGVRQTNDVNRVDECPLRNGLQATDNCCLPISIHPAFREMADLRCDVSRRCGIPSMDFQSAGEKVSSKDNFRVLEQYRHVFLSEQKHVPPATNMRAWIILS
jgi:hypothetical protein